MTMRKKIIWLLALTVLLAGICRTADAAELKTPAMPQNKPVVPDKPVVPKLDDDDAYSGPPAVPAASFFPILPLDADADTETAPQLLPIASNHPLSDDHTNITRAILFVHDFTRDANGAIAMLSALTGPNNDAVLIIAPQFLLQSDITRFTGHLPDGGKSLAHWGLNAWEDGGNSIAHAPQKGVSSFTAIDLLLLYLGDKKAFPNLKDVVIAGHGEGADFVLRYAAAGQAPDLVDEILTVRFAAANASSFLYYTSLRPLAGKPGFGLPKSDNCPNYNTYKYGLQHLNSYAQHTGSDAIRLRYPSRRVNILAGAKTVSNDPFPDTSCAAQMQGPNRFMRALNYGMYISTIFNEAEKTQSFSAITDAGYDPVAMFNSDCGMNVLFGDGNCKPAEPMSSETSQSR